MKILGIVLAVFGILLCLGIRFSSGPTLLGNQEEWQRTMAREEKKIRDASADSVQELASLQQRLAGMKRKTTADKPNEKTELTRETAELAAKLEELAAKLQQAKAKQAAAVAAAGADAAAAVAAAVVAAAENNPALKERQILLSEEIRTLSRAYDRLKQYQVSPAAANEKFNPIPAVQ